jgi:hypothetical protein
LERLEKAEAAGENGVNGDRKDAQADDKVAEATSKLEEATISEKKA